MDASFTVTIERRRRELLASHPHEAHPHEQTWHGSLQRVIVLCSLEQTCETWEDALQQVAMLVLRHDHVGEAARELQQLLREWSDEAERPASTR
jgi:hypothetical protein